MTGEFPSVSKTLTRRAQKIHICCECHREIKPGDEYQWVDGCWNRTWATYKTCAPCAALRDLLTKDLCSDENIAFGYLDEAADCADMPFPPPKEA